MIVTKSLRIDDELWNQAKSEAALAGMTLIDWISEAIKEKINSSSYTETSEFKKQAVKYCESQGYVLADSKTVGVQTKERKVKKEGHSALGKRKEEEDSLLGI
jgi:hypothetical protein